MKVSLMRPLSRLPFFFGLTAYPAHPIAIARTQDVLRDKTLVVWAAPANLTQRGGSALTIEDRRDHFDGIVFGERAPAKWMAGSDMFSRTLADQASVPAETAEGRTFVQIAIVYRGSQVAIYRNGQPISQYAMPTPPREFGPDSRCSSANAIGNRATTRISLA